MRGVLSMDNEVIHSSFRTSLVGGIAGVGAIAILGFWFAGFIGHNGVQSVETEVEVQPVAPLASASGGVISDSRDDFNNQSIRGSDLYLVAARNLTEGQVLSADDVEVVKMPGLRGYELAFSEPYPVVGMKLSHAVPYGQPVLPYHVEESLRARTYSSLSPEERGQ